jgi:hypothetical protein
MKRDEWLAFHEAQCARARELSARKGKDYSGDVDTLANLKFCEAAGVCTAQQGVTIRLLDKIKRLGTLIGSGAAPAVKDESVEDTLLDVVNYALLIMALRKEAKAGEGHV